MLSAFEEADRRRAATGTHDQLTFVIVGGGPTGVELAGALAEIGRKAMGPDFPTLQLEDLCILLVEGGPRIFPGFSADLSAKAEAALARMGVTIRLKSLVSAVREDGVMIGQEFVPSTGIIWAAGNKASPFLETLGASGWGRSGEGGPGSDDFGRALDLRAWRRRQLYGNDGKPLPGLAPVAIQQGRYVAELIDRQTLPEQRRPFSYADRGMLATIGRAKAVAQIGRLHVSGLFAWLLWCIVHIFFLIGVRSRLRVMSEWIWYYITFKPGARLLFEQPARPHNERATMHRSNE